MISTYTFFFWQFCDKNCEECGKCKGEWAGASGCLQKMERKAVMKPLPTVLITVQGKQRVLRDCIAQGPALTS